MLDTGLLAALSGLDAKVLLDGNKIFNEFKGSLIKQYVLQQLKCEKDLPLFYWSSVTGTSEVDFIIQTKEMIIPVEVKASKNLRAKSIKVYQKKYNPEISVRISMSDYRKENWLINLPLYALPALGGVLNRNSP